MPPQPPPSQAGKFKPRKKPAKKIRVGEATGATATTGRDAASEAPPEVSAPAPTSTRGGAEPPVRGGRGGRAPAGGGGRGGGRPAGRGGGRSGGRGGAAAHVPLEQGQAFFQAAAPPPPAGHSSRRSNAAASASSGGRGPGPSAGALNRPATTRAAARSAASSASAWGEDVQEEIIGILDEGVGAAATMAPSDDKKRGARAGSTGDASGGGPAPGSSSTTRRRKGSHAAVPEASIYYDDDSSDESEHGRENLSKPQHDSTDRLLPMALPETRLPTCTLSAERPEKVPSDGGPVDASVGGGCGVLWDNPLLALTSKLQRATLKDSGTTTSQGGRGEDWLLVQLPTRLPPLKQADSPPAITSSVVGAGGDVVPPLPGATASAAQPAQFVWPATGDSRGTLVSDDGPISVPSVMSGRFDHDALRSAQPGRLGRLVVYKSGAMHLLLEGPDGTPTIRMNVTGRECGLVQQAVSVDPNERNLVMLGNVQHSLVVTPDLSVD